MEPDEHLEFISALPSVSTPRRKAGRSFSAPAPGTSSFDLDILSELGGESESKFLCFGDSVALYSETDDSEGFVSTLG